MKPFETVRNANDARDTERVESQQYFTFFLKDARYGIGIDSVREIREFGGICAVPCVPEYLRGVINVRGEIIPVIDLSLRLFGRRTGTSRFTAVAIMEVAGRGGSSPVGVMVDRVDRVREIDGSGLIPADAGCRTRPDFLKGIVHDGDTFITLLDGDRVLDLDEMSETVHASGGERISREARAEQC